MKPIKSNNLLIFLVADYDKLNYINYISREFKNIFAIYPFNEIEYQKISEKFYKNFDYNSITEKCLNFTKPIVNIDIFESSKDYFRLFALALERYAFHGLSPMFVEHKFENAVSFWIEKFTKNKITFVVFGNVPHLHSEISAVYALKLLNIPFVFKVAIALDHPNLFFWSDDIIELKQIKLEITEKNSLKINKKIKTAMEGFVHLKTENRLRYMRIAKKTNLSSYIKFKIMNFYFFGFFVWSLSYLKKENRKRDSQYIDSTNLFDTPKSIFDYRRIFLKRSSAINTLRKQEIKFSKKNLESLPKNFLYFPLHYQPEATTVPMAFRNYNQINLIRKIMSIIDPKYHLVVKEHPTTFHNLYKADRGRWKNYYRELSAVKNVTLISYKTNSELLMQKSKAIIALNGTSVLEATLKYNKISFVFSENPFLELPGVIKFTNFLDFSKNYEQYLKPKKSKNNLESNIKFFINKSKGKLSTFENYDDYNALSKIILNKIKLTKNQNKKTKNVF